MTTWLISTLLALAPAPAGPEVLDTLPDDFEVVVRVVDIKATASDLEAMIEAMSPTLARQATPQIDAAVQQFTAAYGEEAARSTFLLVMPLPGLEAMQGGQTPPFAIVVEDAPYDGVLQAISGDEDPEPEAKDGGYAAIEDRQASTVFAFDGGSFTAFGSDEGLIALIAGGAEGGASLSGKLGEAGIDRLFTGDVGLYVDLEAVEETYGETIAQARQQFFDAMEAAGQQAGNAEMMEGAVAFYEQLFDMAGDARSIVVALDAEQEGLSLGLDLGVDPDSEAAGTLASFGTGPIEGPEETLPRLPDDASYFFVLNADAGALTALQRFGMSTWFGPIDETPPELDDAVEAMGDAGSIRMAGSSSFGDGLQQAYLMAMDDPGAYVSSALDLYRAMDSAAGPVGKVIKRVEVTPGAETYEDVSMTRVVMSFDLEAMSGGPQAQAMTVQSLRAVLGGDSITTWIGTTDRYAVYVNAVDWEAARGLIDRIRAAEGSIGESASYRAIRPELPDEVGALMMINVQGIVEMMAGMFSSMFDADLTPPADMPAEPALIGASLIASGEGLGVDLFVPSPVGQVIERGMIPLFQQLEDAAP